ncbi:serine hydroxymethyltransferase [Streptomyces sp. PTM05]|uniref:Serine hydroxymethyltransferase n=1 Tax=Streptantibioticus parmotrematis TaxID=2873249 RepID=A0ABS7QZM3_9ACTN|nr:serine hydroxymethyltransferase [Streptantibioticus parmotrematis]MBY8888655.1 serine hydroxymethyltransferase [Streptantibioticus parmotrematis]
MTVARTTQPSRPPSRATAATYGPQVADFEALRAQDPELAGVLLAEYERQTAGLQLIAAENFASPAVLAALGSPLANKYAEGYPGRRHHGGCELVDLAERIAVERACALFGADHANVQPYSGSSAVLAAYAALLVPGDTVLAMSLPHGGHLTHGSPANFSGRWFDFAGYGVDPATGLIDYDEVRDLALARRPKAIVAGSIAYPRHLDHAAFRAIADEVDAYLVVDAAHTLGLVAGGAAPSPVPYADVVCATTHKTLRGPRGGLLLCRAELAQRVDRAVFPFTQGGPQMHTVAATAVALGEAASPAFRTYARRTMDNGRALAAALAAEDIAPQTGGTDTHLVAADVTALCPGGGLVARGRCAAARIYLDKVPLPGDLRPPAPPGLVRGVRLGTAAVTTQGMGEREMTEIASLVARALREEPGVAADAAALACAFPPYPGGGTERSAALGAQRPAGRT